ncbi:iron chelate uptake ABC transporter family permease subunit [Escherichia coli]
MSKRIALFPALLLALLVIAATALTWMNFSQALPRSQWAQAAWSPDIDVIEQMIFHYSLLPRLAISLLVFADWCGRMVLFPFQIPAGLLSTFIGAPYFIYLLRKQSR